LRSSCGVNGNSILFTNGGNVTFAYKCGVHTGRGVEDVNFWRFSRENCEMIHYRSSVVALRVECQDENRAFEYLRHTIIT
ncbi:hypothetical protein CARUB_v10025296mg, partial [Capsella rubella]